MSVYSGSSNLAAKVSKIYAGVDNVARKVSKAYMGDANNVAQLIYSAETPLEISYTGTYTDEIVTMSDGTYRLLTLSGSGTLTFNQQVECDIWACGGGGGGGKSSNSSGGGGGGYSSTAWAAIIQNLTIIIGAGGANNYAGSGTTVTGDFEFGVLGGSVGSVTAGGDGGSGGGGRGRSTGYTGGNGQGSTTRPFADATLPPYCAGGGGGSYNSNYAGGAGGSDGGNGGDGSDANSSTAAPGGYLGGGSGSVGTGTAPGDATAWGGGGGGARSGVSGNTGAGYQGCVMVRIPVTGYIAFTVSQLLEGGTISNTVNYVAKKGMTWIEWMYSEYNTGGITQFGDSVVRYSDVGAVMIDANYERVYVDDVIAAGGQYYGDYREY